MTNLAINSKNNFKPKQESRLFITIEDLLITARTIYGEARGEPISGQLAVASVIKNRASEAQVYRRRTGKSHPLFGDGTLAGACQARWQFSCWNQSDPNRKKILAVGFNDPQFCKALSVAARVMGNLTTDKTHNSLHYHHHGISPRWITGKQPVAKIGQHLFYNNID